MNKFGKLFFKALPHVSIVMAGMMIVFFCIDRFNTPMGFMTNEFHKVITFALALISIGMAVRIMALQRREAREAYRRQRQQQPAAPTPRRSAATASAAPRRGQAATAAPRRGQAASAGRRRAL